MDPGGGRFFKGEEPEPSMPASLAERRADTEVAVEVEEADVVDFMDVSDCAASNSGGKSFGGAEVLGVAER